MVPAAGVLHLGVPFDRSWSVRLDGVALEARPGFGVTTAVDVPGSGTLEIAYAPPSSRMIVLLAVAALWVAAVVALTRRDPSARRPREAADRTIEPVAELDLSVPVSGEVT